MLSKRRGKLLVSSMNDATPLKRCALANIFFLQDQEMFFLFANKLGCMGSLLISAVLTLILLSLLGVLNFSSGGW